MPHVQPASSALPWAKQAPQGGGKTTKPTLNISCGIFRVGGQAAVKEVVCNFTEWLSASLSRDAGAATRSFSSRLGLSG